MRLGLASNVNRLLYTLLLCSTFVTGDTMAQGDYSVMSTDLDSRIEKWTGDREAFRVATFNVSLNRFNAGDLISDLSDPSDQLEGSDEQIRAVAEIIQRVRPDVVLLNEFDYDEQGVGIELFQQNFLLQSQNGQPPIDFPYVFNAPSNTGVPSGVDLNGDGSVGGPNDAFGFGFFPGQFGMVVLSRVPILSGRVRTFQRFLWADMPGALLPDDVATPEPGDFYSPEALEHFRLSSKSHWDVPVLLGDEVVHILAAHPTPPVFDGPEDANGRRNHDEIRFWADYVGPRSGSKYIYDDTGRRGGLPGSRFVIVGDYNADPLDGDSADAAIDQLLQNPLVNDQLKPASLGGIEDSLLEGQANEAHRGNAALDTADFNPRAPGNLRVDYVLPSTRGLVARAGGVFWPNRAEQETRGLVGDGFPVVSSDHHLVWIDVVVRR